MSSLIFYTEKEQALTATDTLATSPDGEPFMFTTKAFVLPHLQMIIAGTGIQGFLGKWFVEVNDRSIVRGIDNLNYHTPAILASLWNQFREENSIPNGPTTSIYHLGFSEVEGVIHAYAYRSVNGFASESVPYCRYVQPDCPIPENPVFPDVITQIMEKQRVIQETLPKNKRVHIGGNIQIHHLTKDGFYIHTLHKFYDFESVQQMIYDNYESGKKASQGHPTK